MAGAELSRPFDAPWTRWLTGAHAPADAEIVVMMGDLRAARGRGRVGGVLLAVVSVLALACADAAPAANGSDTGDGSSSRSGSGDAHEARGDEPPDPSIDASGEAGSGSATGGSSGAHDTTGAPEPHVPPPPYPIVLAHGFFGFEDFAGVDFVTYFYEVRERLEDEGEPLVFTPAVDPFNDSTTRGLQLLAEVEAIVAETGAGKVNLVGHSQGGLDARVVASLRPDLVASVTTFATPHQGTPVADVALGLSDDDDAAAIVDALVQIVGAGLWEAVDGDTSLAKSMEQLSTPGMALFNETYPDADGVLYFSLAGRSAYHDGGPGCIAEDAPDFVSMFEDDRDAIEPLLSVTQAMLAESVFDPIANDGLVRAGDAHWGTFLGCVPADHFDEIGQLFGDTPGLTNAWRHGDFYVAVVAWLRARGV